MATSKENFDDWIQKYLQGKRNTVLMTDETYKEIVEFLLGNKLPSKCDRRIEKRVKKAQLSANELSCAGFTKYTMCTVQQGGKINFNSCY